MIITNPTHLIIYSFQIDVLNNLLMAGISDNDGRLSEKLTSTVKSNIGGRSTVSPRSSKRSFGMDGTLALVQAAEHVGMLSGSSISVSQAALNGVTTTAVIAHDGAVDGEHRTSGDDEQPGFGSTSQTAHDLSTISPQAIYLTGNLCPEQLIHHQTRPGEISEVTLVRLKARSQSVGNFAVHLVREMFKPHELVSKNVSGNGLRVF